MERLPIVLSEIFMTLFNRREELFTYIGLWTVLFEVVHNKLIQFIGVPGAWGVHLFLFILATPFFCLSYILEKNLLWPAVILAYCIITYLPVVYSYVGLINGYLLMLEMLLV